MEKLIIKPKEDPYVYMSVRIKRQLQEQYTSLADLTGYSRNELINIALQFALEHMEVIGKE